MASLVKAYRSYTLVDGLLILGLGLLGGIVNIVATSIPHQHFHLWDAQVPYASIFVLAPVIAMLLVRKPGAALLTALLYGTVQAVALANVTSLLFGFTEGLGAELVFALFAYRRFDAFMAFLAGGIGAKTLGNLWSLATSSGGHMMMGMGMQQAQHYPAWQRFLGNEILALVVSGIMSGLVGWALAKLIERSSVLERVRARSHRPSTQSS